MLGPQLFAMYTAPLVALLQDSDIGLHLYADDTQLYLRFDPRSPTSIDLLLEKIQHCTSVIREWMQTHFLKLNSEKTEVMVITSPHLRCPQINTITIGDFDPLPSPL